MENLKSKLKKTSFCLLQEKKGVVVDPAQREQQEIAKLDKILLMVRDPPEGKN